MVERHPYKVDVIGSSPVAPTIFDNLRTRIPILLSLCLFGCKPVLKKVIPVLKIFNMNHFVVNFRQCKDFE